MSYLKHYFATGLWGAVLFLVGCLPTTAEPITPSGGERAGIPTPTLAAVVETPMVPTAEPTAEPTADIPENGAEAEAESPPEDEDAAAGGFETPDDSVLTITQEESPFQNGWMAKVADGSEQRVVGEDGREYYYVRLRLSNPNTGESRTVIEEWRPYGLGFDVPAVLKWSADTQSIYYTNVPHPDGCVLFVNGWDLHQFNYVTGEQTTILEEGGLSLAMAAHDQLVAYGRGNTLHILNRYENSVTPLELSGEIGAMIWAPDTQSVLVTVIENACSSEMRYSFVQVAVGTNEVSVVRPPTAQQLTIEAWPTFDEVQLRDQEGGLWLLNPNTGELVSAADLQTGAPPAGLVYHAHQEIVRVAADGSANVIATAEWLNLSPDGQRGAYFDYQANELIVVDLQSGEQTVTGSDFYGVQQISWLDNGRLLLGVILNESNIGPNNGFLTLYDIERDEFVMLDDSQLMFSQPAADPAGLKIAYDSGGTARIYDVASGTSAPFDPTAFAGWSFDENTRLGSPSYAPDGSKLAWIIGGPTVAFGEWGAAVAVFDLQAQTVTIVGEYAIVGTDGWPAAAQWSPDGRWVAVHEWAVERAEEGLWLYRIDGSERQHLGAQTAEGVWSPDGTEIAFTRYGQDGAREYFRLKVDTGEKVSFELPGFARLIGWFS